MQRSQTVEPTNLNIVICEGIILLFQIYYYMILLYDNIIESGESDNNTSKEFQEMERVADNAKFYRAEQKVKNLCKKEQKLKSLTYKVTLLDIIEKNKNDKLLLETLRIQEEEKATRDEESAHRKERYERYAKIGSSEGILKIMRKSYGYNELIHSEPFDPAILYDIDNTTLD